MFDFNFGNNDDAFNQLELHENATVQLCSQEPSGSRADGFDPVDDLFTEILERDQLRTR